MPAILISQNASQSVKNELSNQNFEIISLPPNKSLDPPVACHADMLIFKQEKTLLTSREYYETANGIFKRAVKSGYTVTLSRSSQQKEYPNDILFNAFRHGNKIFGLEKHLAPEIKEWYGGNLINTRQGYANCSCASVGNGVITSDPSLATLLTSHGIDVLRIQAGHIVLDGYDYGFIGGTSFEFNDCVFFFGNLFSHPDGKSIAEFCSKHGKKAISLSNEQLCDLGSAIVI